MFCTFSKWIWIETSCTNESVFFTHTHAHTFSPCLLLWSLAGRPIGVSLSLNRLPKEADWQLPARLTDGNECVGANIQSLSEHQHMARFSPLSSQWFTLAPNPWEEIGENIIVLKKSIRKNRWHWVVKERAGWGEGGGGVIGRKKSGRREFAWRVWSLLMCRCHLRCEVEIIRN